MTGQGNGGDDEWGKAAPAGSGPPKPGDIIIDPQLAIAPEPLVGHDVSDAARRGRAGAHDSAGAAVGP